MNRRSFLETLAKAAAGFTILPAATTYGRVWRAQRPALDWDDLRRRLYRLVRDRNRSDLIDAYTDAETAKAIAGLYECTIIPPRKTILRSVKYTVHLDLPDVIENFSGPVGA